MYRTFYVHAHAIRSISLYAFLRLCITAPIAAHTSVFFLIKDSSWRSLIFYVQYIHFRFPGPHHRFRQARGNVDVDQLRLSARFKTRIISIRIWFGTPDGMNIFVGRWKTSAHFATLRNPIFRRRNVDFAFKKRKDYPDFLAYNLHNNYSTYQGK